jgi:hypothetical protein
VPDQPQADPGQEEGGLTDAIERLALDISNAPNSDAETPV